MSVFSKVLVPFDGSDVAIRALAVAVDIVAEGGSITIIQATDSPNAIDPTVAVADNEAGIEPGTAEADKQAGQYWEGIGESLERIARQAVEKSDKDIEVKKVVEVGNPASVITSYAEDNDMDIIVMGRRGLGAVRAMLGSVSQRVAHETDVPLLLVK